MSAKDDEARRSEVTASPMEVAEAIQAAGGVEGFSEAMQVAEAIQAAGGVEGFSEAMRSEPPQSGGKSF